jgi:hypothetical protein
MRAIGRECIGRQTGAEQILRHRGNSLRSRLSTRLLIECTPRRDSSPELTEIVLPL